MGKTLRVSARIILQNYRETAERITVKTIVGNKDVNFEDTVTVHNFPTTFWSADRYAVIVVRCLAKSVIPSPHAVPTLPWFKSQLSLRRSEFMDQFVKCYKLQRNLKCHSFTNDI